MAKPRQFYAGAAGIALFLLTYYALTWRGIEGITNSIKMCPELFCDFVTYYYPMGEEIFRTGLPVPGFLYSPFIAILMAVFPPLGLTASLVLWGALQVLFMILYLLIFRRLVPAGLAIQLLFVFLTLSSFPILLNFIGGQVSVFMTVSLLGLLVLKERGRNAIAAILLVFAASFKFYPIIFVAPFVASRDTRFILFTAAACGAILFVIPGVMLGSGDMLNFYDVLFDSFRESDWVVTNPHSQFFPHFLPRLVDAVGGDSQTQLPLLRWISFGIAAINLGLIYAVLRARLSRAYLWSFQLVYLTIPFVLKSSWPHDFVFLSFTQALLAWRLMEGGKAGAKERSHAGTILMVALLLISIVFSNIIFFNLFGDFSRYGFYGFLFWANLALLIALYAELLPPAIRSILATPIKNHPPPSDRQEVVIQ